MLPTGSWNKVHGTLNRITHAVSFDKRSEVTEGTPKYDVAVFRRRRHTTKSKQATEATPKEKKQN